ncbi:hypothetical protein CLV01_3378 [Delftia sp. 60]|uniref:hypothetical protein n=1 Tax=Delftia sp. 60 TaxID=2035216 RepID=UPI000C1A18FF|nr:hypothetical protein [Delftia sp. 60]PIF37844.1 hypothetical protein CLU98_3072 [Burkholderiales bacterium 23]PIF66976.1 hypothetical protein CLV01_3378 [Delftia sp. 60]
MPNALVKDKKLVQYIPAVPEDPGFPGTPAVPARTTYEWRDVRIEASASSMSVHYTYEYDRTGETRSVGSLAQVPEAFRASAKAFWTTPLDVLRKMVGNPGLGASAANYSDVWGVVQVDRSWVRAPLTWTSAWIIRRENVRIDIPAQPAVPPRPPRKGTPARSSYDMHFGWNAGARSLRELPAGWVGTVQFRLPRHVGAVVGLAPVGRAPGGVSGSFPRYGLLFGDGQIRVREADTNLRQVGTPTGNDAVRAEISAGRIDWFVNDVLVHRGPFSMPGGFVLDALLYAGDDTVDAPLLKDGVAQNEESVLMMAPLSTAATALEPLQLRLGLRPLDLFASELPMAQAKARLRPVRVAGDPIPRGALQLLPAQVRASDAARDAVARVALARLRSTAQVEGGDGAWIPRYSIGSMVMPPPAVFGAITGGQSHDYRMALGAAFTVASQDAHAEGRLRLAAGRAQADMEALGHLVRALNLMEAGAQLVTSGYVTVVIAERMGAAGTLVLGAAGLMLDVHEQIGSQAETQISGAIVASVLEHLGAVERYRALVFRVVDGRPVLMDPGHAWVVNTESSASTRYEGYAFDSFMTVGGRHFGVRADGLYRLGGATDAGLPIAWGAGLGKHDFGSQAIKRLAAVHAGVSATGQLYVRIGDGQQTWTYRARRVDAAQRVQRFDPGRGLAANYFTFDLVGEGAAELDNIVFGVVAGQRRIGGRN